MKPSYLEPVLYNERSPRSLQLEKAHAQQWKPTKVKTKYKVNVKNNFIKKNKIKIKTTLFMDSDFLDNYLFSFLFIWLCQVLVAAPGIFRLHCSMKDLLVVYVVFLVAASKLLGAAYKLLVGACGI